MALGPDGKPASPEASEIEVHFKGRLRVLPADHHNRNHRLFRVTVPGKSPEEEKKPK